MRVFIDDELDPVWTIRYNDTTDVDDGNGNAPVPFVIPDDQLHLQYLLWYRVQPVQFTNTLRIEFRPVQGTRSYIGRFVLFLLIFYVIAHLQIALEPLTLMLVRLERMYFWLK